MADLKESCEPYPTGSARPATLDSGFQGNNAATLAVLVNCEGLSLAPGAEFASDCGLAAGSSATGAYRHGA